jgi:integrase
MKMKVKGNGTVRQVINSLGKPVKNSWQLVLNLGNDPITKKRKQACRHFRGNKTDARRALEEFRREIESGLKLDADTVTFGEYARQWMESRQASGRLAESTIQHNSYTLKHLLKHLDHIRLADIDSTAVRNLYNALNASGVGDSGKRHASIMLNQILEQAMNDDIILRNPCSRVEAPKAPRSNKGTALDKQGVTRLLAALDDSINDYPGKYRPDSERYYHALVNATATRLALATGLRRGEALGLRWVDVDLENALLFVRHSLCSKSGQLREPKTVSGNRVITLPTREVGRLQQWKRYQAEYLLAFGIRQTVDTPVITSEIGGWLDGNNLNRWWKVFRKRYGFDGLRFHDLRHTHATMLVSSGLNIKAVSSRLGHSSVGITLDLYSHAQREDDLQAASVISQLMDDEAPQMGQVVNL